MTRPSGFTKAVKALIAERDGWACARCGMSVDPWPGYSYHHRRPRGMGGTSDPVSDSPANGVLLCGSGTTGCHGWVEQYRIQARYDGWLVQQGSDPADVAVATHRGWVFLGHDGSATPKTDSLAATTRIAAGSDTFDGAVRARQDEGRRGA